MRSKVNRKNKTFWKERPKKEENEGFKAMAKKSSGEGERGRTGTEKWKTGGTFFSHCYLEQELRPTGSGRGLYQK